ncbi:MAG: Type 1 glutamine amidotransferase-like domain-containing protein [Candidatus Nanopelagicales bacterium]
MPGPLALVGSGEYLPVMQDLEAGLIAGRPPRYVQLATAAAPEGPASLGRWRDLGAAQAERIGVEQVWVPVTDRASADDPDNAALVAGAGLVYLSGGNPAYLAETLAGTAVWEAIVTAWQAGAALAGCSAGAMAMSTWVPHIRPRLSGPAHVDGLGLLPHVRVIPHFDRMLGRVPDLLTRYLLHAPDGVAIVGVDEDTALVGGPHEWTVRGRSSAWLLGHGRREEYPAGSTVTIP